MKTDKKQSNTENLENQDAINKLKELVAHNPVCLFATRLGEMPIQVRPMSAAKVCDQGNVWFLSDKDSNKNEDIAMDPNVQLFFSNPGDQEYLTIYGKGSIITDKRKIEALWSPLDKAWFTEGVNDPAISVIKVTPIEAHYWDTRNGKMIAMLKFAAAALTGKEINEGVSGSLTL